MSVESSVFGNSSNKGIVVTGGAGCGGRPDVRIIWELPGAGE